MTDEWKTDFKMWIEGRYDKIPEFFIEEIIQYFNPVHYILALENKNSKRLCESMERIVEINQNQTKEIERLKKEIKDLKEFYKLPFPE